MSMGVSCDVAGVFGGFGKDEGWPFKDNSGSGEMVVDIGGSGIGEESMVEPVSQRFK